MTKWVNGKIIELTPEEELKFSRVSPESVRSDSAIASAVKVLLRPMLATMTADEVLSVEPLVDSWEPGDYAIGAVGTREGQVWRCGQAHDSRINSDVIPGQIGGRAFWFPYHARDQRYAKLFVQPTCREDTYMNGEWMIYNERRYRCRRDYVDRSPDVLPDAWEKG